jgi:hypothetical protein
MKTSGFEISHDAEVTQRAKTSGQTLGKLEQAVDRLDGAIGESSFQEGDNAAPMFLNALAVLGLVEDGNSRIRRSPASIRSFSLLRAFATSRRRSFVSA